MSETQLPSSVFALAPSTKANDDTTAPNPSDSHVPRTLPPLKHLVAHSDIVSSSLFPSNDDSLKSDSFPASVSSSYDKIGASAEEVNADKPPSLMQEQDSLVDMLPLRMSSSTDPSGRPTIPYATLITRAIESAPDQKITLSGIYAFAMEHYPYFRTASTGWKNSIRHNLSLNKNFVRVPRPANERGKGAYWTLAPSNGKKARTRVRSSSEPLRYDGAEEIRVLINHPASYSLPQGKDRFTGTPYARSSRLSVSSASDSKHSSQENLFPISEVTIQRRSPNVVHPAIMALRTRHNHGVMSANSAFSSDLDLDSSFSSSNHSLGSDLSLPLSAVSGELATKFAEGISFYPTGEDQLYASPERLPFHFSQQSESFRTQSPYATHSRHIQFSSDTHHGGSASGDETVVFPYNGLVPYGDQFATYEGSGTALPWVPLQHQDSLNSLADLPFPTDSISESLNHSSPSGPMLFHQVPVPMTPLKHPAGAELLGLDLDGAALMASRPTLQLSDVEKAMIAQAAVEAVWDPSLTSQGFYDQISAASNPDFKWDDLQ